MTINSKRLLSFLFLQVLLIKIVFAQTESEAKKLFESRDYKAAFELYQTVIKEKPNDWEVHLNAGICLLNINGDRKKAIEYLEKANDWKKNHLPILIQLAKAYQYAEKYYEAGKIYEEIIPKASEKIKPELELEAEYASRARDFVLEPKNVSFINLGKKINSEFPDYYPIVPENNAFLAFTSRRKGNTGNIIQKDGFYSSDVYICDFKNGSWQKAKNAGIKVNTLGDEQPTGCTHDGKNLVLYTDYGGKNFGDLYITENTKNNNFEKPKNIGEKINSSAMESSGSYSEDGNTLFFSSEREGGIGATDLYFSKKLPSGEWTDPENLGALINTELDEDFPIVSEDGTTLTFSSMGHNSIGGFDVFVSKWDSITEKWGAPENMGYPINTSADEMSFCFNRNKDAGYMSCWREDSNGDLDIYKVIFNDLVAPQSSFLYSRVIAGDTIRPYVRASITVTDKITKDTVGIYNPKRNGKFLMILPVGLYVVSIESNGFELYSQDLYVAGEDLYVAKDYKTFNLKKIGSPDDASPVILKNETKENNILLDNKKSEGGKNDNSKIGTDKIASPKKSIPKVNKPKK
jgi:tetratricopeptide (TPR) repeat protein